MRTAIVYNFLLEANLMASIAILLMLPIRRYLRSRLGSRALCCGWLLVALRLLCPLALPNPAISSIRSPFAPDEAIRPIAGQIQVRFSDAVFDAYQWARNAAGRESDVAQSLGRLVDSTGNGMLSIRLMQIYLIGLCVVLGWFLWSNLRFRHRLHADRIEPISGKLLEQYQALCAEQRVKPLPCWYVDPLPSACLVGVLHLYIALPLTAAPQEALQVLKHEVCHYRGRDHWWGAVRLLCCAVHWFNPLVWLAAHLSRTDLELSCDDRVTEKLNPEEKKAYAGVLVLAAARRDLPGVAVLSTGMSMTGRKLKARVNAILQDRHVSRSLSVAFVILASMTLVGAFATAEYLPRPQTPQTVSAVSAPSAPAITEDAVENQQELIDYAKEVWQHEAVQEQTDGFQWSASKVNGHYEVLAKDADGNVRLASAFLPSGQLIYLCNLVSGDRDAFLSDAPVYKQDEAFVEQARRFAVEAVSALAPPLSEAIQSIAFRDESDCGDTRFFHFAQQDENDSFRYGVRVEIHPEVRLTYFIDSDYFSSDDADRLEPGNG